MAKSTTSPGTSLIAGAYAAAGGHIKDKGLGATQGIQKISKTIGDAIAPFAQADIKRTQAVNKELKKNFDEYSSYWMNRSSDLPQADQDNLHKLFKKERVKYLIAGPKKRGEITQAIGKWRTQYDDSIELKDQISMTNSSQEQQGTNWDNLKTTPKGQSIARIMSGEQEATWVNGVMGYEITDQDLINENKTKVDQAAIDYKRLQELHTKLEGNDFLEDNEAREYHSLAKGDYNKALKDLNTVTNTKHKNSAFMSIYDIRKMVDENTFDVNSRGALGTTVEYVKRLGGAEGAGEFDSEDIEFKIKTEILDKANIKSLIYDSHVPTKGGSFYKDLQSRLIGTTYEELGITEDMLSNIDDELDSVKLSDGICDGSIECGGINEAKIIADELVKDENMVDDYLTKYFTLYMKNQYDKVRSPNINDQGILTDYLGNKVVSIDNLKKFIPTKPINNIGEDGLTSFEREFKKQRKLQGSDGTFTWNGNVYNTKYKEEASGELKPIVKKKLNPKPINEKQNKIELEKQNKIELEKQKNLELEKQKNLELEKQKNLELEKNKDIENYTTSYTEMDSLSVKGIKPGKADILENGKAITMKNVSTGKFIFGKEVKVNITGMRVDGMKIMVDTNLGRSEAFGEFKKDGNKYKWVPNPDFVKSFETHATKEQQASFDKFIWAIENDPEYAKVLMAHMKGGEGAINAGTLVKA